MKWPIVELLDQLGIAHTDVDRDPPPRNVAFRCPMCGDDDPSMHMGVNLTTGAWGCWRHPIEHAGRNPYRLVRELTGWPHEQIVAFIGDDTPPPDSVAGLRARLDALDAPDEATAWKPPPALPFEPTFNRFLRGHKKCDHFIGWLVKKRRFRRKDVIQLAKRYRLRWCVQGRFAWRLILPVMDYGRVIGWTGRAISHSVQLRYMAHPPGDTVKQGLFNGDRARGGRVLAVVEGPMDALKLDFYGHGHGVSAVALMGTMGTDIQLRRLRALASRYERVAVILDQGASAQGHHLCLQIPDLRPQRIQLPEGVKDPGDMNPLVAARFAKRMADQLS